MSAPGRPKRELLPLGGTARSAKGAVKMSTPGRPKRELLPLGGAARSAKGAVKMSAPGRPKRELLRPPQRHAQATRLDVGRHPRSQTRPSGLGFALLARASPGGTARSAKGGHP
jgi:hypothetical protein